MVRTGFGSTVFLVVTVMMLTGCGGGGGGGSSTPMPPPQDDLIAIEAAFPGLSFTQPLALLQAPQDSSRWFVVEKAGTVRVFDNDPNVNTMAAFIDISGQVDSGPNEAGLLGMAFHPDFTNNGYVYLSFTVTGAPLVSRIDRFMSNDGGQTLDPATQTAILSVDQDFTIHNGGNIKFGPDGFLYAGFGDGGLGGDANNRAQTTNSLLGTIVRIDVSGTFPYSIPADNPFAGNALCTAGSGNADCPEIFAFGFRNPWRWSFDRQTGELFAGDVGQSSFEEIDRVIISGNYGWNIREGANCFNATNCVTAGLIDPIHEYDRTAGSSVTGGYVYRGSAIPMLVGSYIFGDFSSGRIWAIDPTTQNLVDSTELIDSSLNIASFAESTSGELYIVDLGGSLYRLVAN